MTLKIHFSMVNRNLLQQQKWAQIMILQNSISSRNKVN